MKKCLILLLCLANFTVVAKPQKASSLIIEIPETRAVNGMFSYCCLVLGHLYLFDSNKYTGINELIIDFAEKGVYYDPNHGRNWWEYYFKQTGTLTNKSRYTTDIESGKAWLIRRQLSRKVAASLVKKYIMLNDKMQSAVATFVANNFKGHYVLGVHYRGTDKSREAERVEYPDALVAIAARIAPLQAAKTDYRIFVATDEQPFLDLMRTTYPDRVIAIDAFRSSDSSNVHHSGNNPYKLGEEAVLDAYLLAKCDFLIRTSSNLSLWSTYVNPDLPVIMLNHRVSFIHE